MRRRSGMSKHSLPCASAPAYRSFDGLIPGKALLVPTFLLTRQQMSARCSATPQNRKLSQKALWKHRTGCGELKGMCYSFQAAFRVLRLHVATLYSVCAPHDEMESGHSPEPKRPFRTFGCRERNSRELLRGRVATYSSLRAWWTAYLNRALGKN